MQISTGSHGGGSPPQSPRRRTRRLRQDGLPCAPTPRRAPAPPPARASRRRAPARRSSGRRATAGARRAPPVRLASPARAGPGRARRAVRARRCAPAYPARVPRLDQVLVARGLAESRARAQAYVMAGLVTVDGRPAAKAGMAVADDAAIDLRDPPRFVSRGGDKLANALDGLGFDVAGRDALDVGASTGGFTDCLLQRGAARVIALDVGHGQLHERLRSDPRVTVLERTNARELTPRAAVPRRTWSSSTSRSSRCGNVLRAALGCCAPVATRSRWSSRSSRRAGTSAARGRGAGRRGADPCGLPTSPGTLRISARCSWTPATRSVRARPATASTCSPSPRPTTPPPLSTRSSTPMPSPVPPSRTEARAVDPHRRDHPRRREPHPRRADRGRERRPRRGHRGAAAARRVRRSTRTWSTATRCPTRARSTSWWCSAATGRPCAPCTAFSSSARRSSASTSGASASSRRWSRRS